MKSRIRLGLTAVTAAALLASLAGAAGASSYDHQGSDRRYGSHEHGDRSDDQHSSDLGQGGNDQSGNRNRFGDHGRSNNAVFVENDNLAGNQIVAYDRADDGTLSIANTYATGGLGGQLIGSVVDHTASQGSLVSDGDSLYAVNAGSNTLSVFSVHGDQLSLRQVVDSGGVFPVSVAVRGHFVYVLNALNGGTVQGYFSGFGHLFPIPGTNRPLGLNAAATPQYLNAPSQVAFSPDGGQLIVTTKANGNDIDVFRIGEFGELSATPVVNSDPGAIPFAISFDRAGHLVIAEAGTNSLTSFALGSDGTVTQIARVFTGKSLTCWVVPIGDKFYVSTAGSASVSVIRSSFNGGLTLLGAQATDAGTIDMAATPDGRFLYVQTGANGIVDEFRVAWDGSLTAVGSVTVPNGIAGEGIVAL